MSKKKLTLIILIILGILIFFSSKLIYKNSIYNYRRDLTNSFEKYYDSGKMSDLDHVKEILKTYNNNQNKMIDIQSISNDLLNNWVSYTSKKYNCDTNNKNMCELKKIEMEKLQNKINNLIEYTNSNESKIITDSNKSSINNIFKEEIKNCEEIISDPTSTRQYNEVEIDEVKCNNSTECTNCQESICKCIYTGNGVREEITCKR